jgi:hypothetical protein
MCLGSGHLKMSALYLKASSFKKYRERYPLSINNQT